MAFIGGVKMVLTIVLFLCLGVLRLEGQLKVGFYDSICPSAENIVKEEVSKAVSSNVGLAAGLLRMHFHDCFVRGCDASVLIDSTANNTAEKDAPPNSSLRGFDVVDNAKSRLEKACQGIVSCADILAFAARDSIVLTGAVSYQVPAGRRDGRASMASEALENLPPPFANLDTLTQMFAKKGLTQDEMVTLSGAHTIGVSHCSTFSSRLYGFNSSVSQDPSLDSSFATNLTKQCPQGKSNASLAVPMDPISPNLFDMSYYRNLLVNRGLLTSDQTLMSSNTTAALVKQKADNSSMFLTNFGAAMVNMGQIGVLTGSNGEVRRNCRVIN